MIHFMKAGENYSLYSGWSMVAAPCMTMRPDLYHTNQTNSNALNISSVLNCKEEGKQMSSRHKGPKKDKNG